jgi:hypothetical protein
MNALSLGAQGLVACVSLLLVACSSSSSPSGGSSSGGGGGSGGSLDLAGYYKQYAAVGCARSFDCCRGSGDDLQYAANWQGAVTSKADCSNAAVPSALQDEQKRYASEIAASTVVFHGDEAPACIQAMQKLSCTDFFNNFYDHLPPSCVATLQGKVPAGAACQQSAECVDGYDCLRSEGSVCSLSPKVGDPCTPSGYCPLGSYCESTGKTCAPALSQGSPCDPTRVQCKGLCDVTTSKCGPDIAAAPVCQG